MEIVEDSSNGNSNSISIKDNISDNGHDDSQILHLNSIEPTNTTKQIDSSFSSRRISIQSESMDAKVFAREATPYF